jgi:flavin reductase (DIM6/NTAB) family NADH-FMN oxidoreductase RutF
MRSTAQPVAVISTRLGDAERTIHGATISSYASVALHPFPLVTFAIRKPSRLADALHANNFANPDVVHAVINILAEHQSEIARMFSRPDLYAEPFLSVPYRHEEGMPVLKETVGALACSVLRSFPMTTEVLKPSELASDEPREVLDSERNSSELFIARVTRVVSSRDNSNVTRKPLVYYQREYTSVL